MSKEMARIIASALVLVGVIFFVTGPGLHFVPGPVGLFLGVVCFVIAALVGGLRAVWRE